MHKEPDHDKNYPPDEERKISHQDEWELTTDDVGKEIAKDEDSRSTSSSSISGAKYGRANCASHFKEVMYVNQENHCVSTIVASFRRQAQRALRRGGKREIIVIIDQT